jgi:hypothetical protein
MKRSDLAANFAKLARSTKQFRSNQRRFARAPVIDLVDDDDEEPADTMTDGDDTDDEEEVVVSSSPSCSRPVPPANTPIASKAMATKETILRPYTIPTADGYLIVFWVKNPFISYLVSFAEEYLVVHATMKPPPQEWVAEIEEMLVGDFHVENYEFRVNQPPNVRLFYNEVIKIDTPHLYAWKVRMNNGRRMSAFT